MSTTIDRPDSSLWLTHIAVPISEDRPEPSPLGGVGQYTVLITLRHPATSIFGTDLSHHPGGIMGDSLLTMGHALTVMGVTPQGPQAFHLLPNQHGRLGQVKLDVSAEGIHQAERQAMDIAQPFLSVLAVTQNVALTVHAITTVEQATGAIALSAGLAGPEKPLSLAAGGRLPVVTDPEIAKVFSAYREALNAQDPFQKIITFWRVFEGIDSIRNSMIHAVPLQERKTLFPKEKLPATIDAVPERYRDGASESSFARILGQSHKQAVEAFTHDYRHAVAHMSLDDAKDGTARPVRTADSWSDVMACWNAAQVLEYVLREYLKATLSARPEYSPLMFE